MEAYVMEPFWCAAFGIKIYVCSCKTLGPSLQQLLRFAMHATILDVITNEECNFLIAEFLSAPDVPGFPEDEGHCYRFARLYSIRGICMSWLAAFRAIPQEVCLDFPSLPPLRDVAE